MYDLVVVKLSLGAGERESRTSPSIYGFLTAELTVGVMFHSCLQFPIMINDVSVSWNADACTFRLDDFDALFNRVRGSWSDHRADTRPACDLPVLRALLRTSISIYRSYVSEPFPVACCTDVCARRWEAEPGKSNCPELANLSASPEGWSEPDGLQPRLSPVKLWI